MTSFGGLSLQKKDFVFQSKLGLNSSSHSFLITSWPLYIGTILNTIGIFRLSIVKITRRVLKSMTPSNILVLSNIRKIYGRSFLW